MKNKIKYITLCVFFGLIIACNGDEEHEFIQEEIACDNGTFIGRVTLNTQQEVNDFGALCFTKIDGTLIIDDLNAEDKIEDLSPIQGLTEVFTETYPDSLFASLHFRTSLLTDFNGLNNLEKVGRLIIRNNESLVSLNGLESLKIIGADTEILLFNELTIENNLVLQNLDGLYNLSKIGFGINNSVMNIVLNPALQDIDGLQGLEEVYSLEPISGMGFNGNLWIYGNPQLNTIDGLSNLNTMHGGTISFYFVGDIVDVDGCPSIIGNNNLTDFCGIQNLLANGDYSNVFTQPLGNCYDGFNPSVEDIINGSCSL